MRIREAVLSAKTPRWQQAWCIQGTREEARGELQRLRVLRESEGGVTSAQGPP